MHTVLDLNGRQTQIPMEAILTIPNWLKTRWYYRFGSISDYSPGTVTTLFIRFLELFQNSTETSSSYYKGLTYLTETFISGTVDKFEKDFSQFKFNYTVTCMY